MLDIQTYPNFLNKEEHEYVISKTINGGEWSFIGHSVNEGYKFWYMELINDEFFTNYFFDKIQKITNTKFELDRVYANGQTYGLPGSYHTDSDADGVNIFKTFLYYVNPYWNYQWGGGTFFYLGDENHHQLFTPNCGILFDSTLMHVGLEPTRHCKELRTTIAFKMRIIK